jgi:hypothetical protein
MALATFFCALVHFPNRPPHAPTLSATSTRVDFVVGIRALAGNGPFWIVSLSYGVMTGENLSSGACLCGGDLAETWLGYVR